MNDSSDTGVSAEVFVMRRSLLWRRTLIRIGSLLQKVMVETLVKVLPLPLSRPCHFQVTVKMLSDFDMSQMNEEYRGYKKPTNVLAFQQFDTKDQILTAIKRMRLDQPLHLGDIALSDRTLFQEAYQHQRCLQDHVVHLFIHGMLHLLGYDHQTDEEAEVMESLERELLAARDIDDPYCTDTTH